MQALSDGTIIAFYSSIAINILLAALVVNQLIERKVKK